MNRDKLGYITALANGPGMALLVHVLDLWKP